MGTFTVVAEFDRANRAQQGLEALRGGGIAGDRLQVRPEPDDRPAITVRGVGEDDARRASVLLARHGAVHMRWTDGDGGALEGPGRSHRPGGWCRPARVSLPA